MLNKYWYPNDSLQNVGEVREVGEVDKFGKMMPNGSFQKVGEVWEMMPKVCLLQKTCVIVCAFA